VQLATFPLFISSTLIQHFGSRYSADYGRGHAASTTADVLYIYYIKHLEIGERAVSGALMSCNHLSTFLQRSHNKVLRAIEGVEDADCQLKVRFSTEKDKLDVLLIITLLLKTNRISC